MNSLSEADWQSEHHPLSEATNLLCRWENLEEDKSEICALSAQPACLARMLSLLALSAPTLA
ncbi:hypothetical protein JHK82_048217 [Glycine max]|nr:hypothetical protein JHK82_048217 [Glycine max]